MVDCPIRIPRRVVCFTVLAAGLAGTASVGAEPQYFAHGAVAADHPLASAAGVEVLRNGGNVIDAAVATAMVLSVVRPESSGLGGGGFLVHWNAESQTATAWDYRERAPLSSTADMYVRAEARGVRQASQRGMLAVAVPGQIPGLCEIHRRHGALPLKDVLKPAVRLATEGVPVDAQTIATQRGLLAEFNRHPELQNTFAPLWSGYLNSGKAWQAGDQFRSPQRAALEWLSEQGPQAFTDGPIGEAILQHSQMHGGLLTREDLRQMAPVERNVLRGRYADYEILTMPPPSSGGVALLESLQILAAWSGRDGHKPWRELPEPDRAHVLVEALKHAFADRAEFLGDADFVDVPIQRLLSAEHAERLAAKIGLDKTHPPEEYGRFESPKDAGTTHFCVMDAAGNAVACTETINTTFGSFVVEPRTGIVLNNEMDDFTAIPGQPNAFGLKQSVANAIAPRKKPLSSMTPTIVVKDGRAVAIAGASGGPRIITATLQVLLLILEFDLGAQAAVSAPRLHHQWQPDEVLIEKGLEPLEAALIAKGHRVRQTSSLAATQALRRLTQGLEPGSDPRKHGVPAGY
ncbi:MAG: gamma-glutamyltransferase [Planctomycetales bacterium 12-60-4]|nr:MAG: gamma-glutamyltransferase [Planctomycetales bacterium 12-60-4]